MEQYIVDIIYRNDIKEFESKVLKKVSAEDFFQRYFGLIARKGRYAMFLLIIGHKQYLEKLDDAVITTIIQHDRPRMLRATSFYRHLQENPREAVIMKHLNDCFQHNSPGCFHVFNIDNFFTTCKKEHRILMNMWLYKYIATDIFDLMLSYRLFLRECIMTHMLLLRRYNEEFMQKMITFKPYLWNITTISFMLENGNLWYIEYTHRNLMKICYNDHFLFKAFAEHPTVIAELSRHCSCSNRWIPLSISTTVEENSTEIFSLINTSLDTPTQSPTLNIPLLPHLPSTPELADSNISS